MTHPVSRQYLGQAYMMYRVNNKPRMELGMTEELYVEFY